ncbi:MAG: hypothetical protein J5I94_22675 [Phaeodactylibacter sp.]|nr:hypothetical protein [Phaeodactylibacter sp.]
MTTQELPLLESLQNAPKLYLKELLGRHGPPTQIFRADPERSTVLVGAGGAKLTIAPFSITDLSGRPAKGEVEVCLKEVFTQGEMMMAGRPTTSEDRLMESGGQILVTARQGGRPLKLAQPLTVGLPVSEKLQNPMAMRLFTGGTSTFQAFSSRQSFDWRMASEKAVRIRRSEGRKYYVFQLQDFNWAGCEFFVARRSSRCMVTARPVSPAEQFDSMLGFLVFRRVHAVARMYPGKHNCTAVNIPGKLSATAHLFGLSQGRLYYGKEVIRRASEKLVDVNMRPVLEKELAGFLKAM